MYIYGKIRKVFTRTHYIQKQTLTNLHPPCIACVNLADTFIEVFPDGTEKEKIFPKLGEIHFLKDNWNMEVVAHESQHAILHRSRGAYML